MLTLDGDRIGEVTAFIARSSEPVQSGHADFPDHPVDGSRSAAFFGRFGLPARLD